ncbi:MAG TPA: DUF2478 domain-containing protein [Beijerinckiaceae bacterium]|nr:DUF2478 domain-containing protein [Beijerinckiaceae bacterium]
MNSSPLHAILYDQGAAVAPLARSLVAAWRRQGLRIAGLIEDHISRPERRSCDMVLLDLASGARIPISEERGASARGCRLDRDAFMRAVELVRGGLDTADILILNKFGKLECEGGGLRALIAEAIEAAVPTVIFVPCRNLAAWRSFAGLLAMEWNLCDLPADGATASERLGLIGFSSEVVIGSHEENAAEQEPGSSLPRLFELGERARR